VVGGHCPEEERVRGRETNRDYPPRLMTSRAKAPREVPDMEDGARAHFETGYQSVSNGDRFLLTCHQMASTVPFILNEPG